MTIRGDASNKPTGLLQAERLAQKAGTSASTASTRPGLRSFMAFPESEAAPEVPAAPPTPPPAPAHAQLALDELSASTTASAPAAQSAARALLQGSPPPAPELAPRSAPAPHLSFFAPTLTALLKRIRAHLDALPHRLLELNPSRREAICQYLESLAGGSPILPAAGRPALSSTDKLRAWVDWRSLGPAHQGALQVFFEELGLLSLAQAILLKAWSDRGIRQWKREDLQDLNAALHGALKLQVPMDREGWQVTRPNLYSWFRLPHEIQEALWNEFSAWRIVDEGPELLVGLIEACRQHLPDRARPQGFDEKVYASLWRNTPELPPASGLQRRHLAFSPTLRDGSIVRNGPVDWSWYGWESSAFSLFLGELSLLWWGPSAPPFWSIGTGLETSIQSQLSLNIGFAGKPAVSQRIQEMEACDVAWVQEEQVVRGHQRSLEAQSLREIVDANASLRRLRTGGTSRGHLQACVSMTKLRPGGLLWWLRQEPLHASDGGEALQFLLDRGKLLAEWDFSEVQLGFPQATGRQALPRFLYLFERETDVQARYAHHPLRIWARGSLRSHVEIQRILDEAIQPAFAASDAGARPFTTLSCQIITQRHPLSQREWADHWPEASETEELSVLDELRRESQPLASIATIRSGISGIEMHRTASDWQGWRAPLRGFSVKAQYDGKRRFLQTASLHETAPAEGALAAGASRTGFSDSEGFTLLVADESLAAPLRSYLESEIVRSWFEQKATRRNQRWVIQEQDLRILPVPNRLLRNLGQSSDPRDSGFALPLPGGWENLAANLPVTPQNVRKALPSLQHDETGTEIRCSLFIRASRILQEVRMAQARTQQFVRPDGRIVWRELIGTFPISEFVPVSIHSGVSIQGQLPLQTPITQASLLKAPQGLLLTTEAGHQARLEIPERFLLEVVRDQIEALDHPTWSEIIEFVRVPRRLDQLEARAADLLRIQGEQQAMIEHLAAIIAETAGSLVRSSGAC